MNRINYKGKKKDFNSENIKNLKVDTEKLKKNLQNVKKDEELIILIESGSLAPPHRMHIGIMELTKKYIENNYKTKKVVGGYLIPSSDGYVKQKLKNDFIPLKHRINMTKIMIQDSDWLECLDWGYAAGEKIKFCLQEIINQQFPDLNIKCILVFGIDYYMKISRKLKDEHICVFRPGYDIDTIKKNYPENLMFVEGKDEDISSTLLRSAIRENDEENIIDLTSKEIVQYIKNNDIFSEK